MGKVINRGWENQGYTWEQLKKAGYPKEALNWSYLPYPPVANGPTFKETRVRTLPPRPGQPRY